MRGSEPKFPLFADQFVFLLIIGEREKELQNRDKKTIWIDFLGGEKKKSMESPRNGLGGYLWALIISSFLASSPVPAGQWQTLVFHSPSSSPFPASACWALLSSFQREGTENKWWAPAENLSVSAELLNCLWDGHFVLLQPDSMLGGTGVDPERSFSMDWASHLLSLLALVLASTADEPAEEEESYEKIWF